MVLALTDNNTPACCASDIVDGWSGVLWDDTAVLFRGMAVALDEVDSTEI